MAKVGLNQILLVDDESHILTSFARGLRKDFNVLTANSGKEALALIKNTPTPIPVIVSDFNMPEMTGDEFFKHCQKVCPDSVRVLLSGKADIESIISCINEGKIFRFMLKPCNLDTMKSTILDCIKQFELIRAEKIILGQTLIGTVQLCVDFLTLANPEVYSYVTKIKNFVETLAQHLKLPNPWRFTIAALLSHTGDVLVSRDHSRQIVTKDNLSNNDKIFHQDSINVSAKIIEKIPKLELISKMIMNQNKSLEKLTNSLYMPIKDYDSAIVGAQLLKTVIDFEKKLSQGYDKADIIAKMQQFPDIYHKDIVEALLIIKPKESHLKAQVKISELTEKMTTAKDVYTTDGKLIVANGQALNSIFIAKLNESYRKQFIDEWIEVYVS